METSSGFAGRVPLQPRAGGTYISVAVKPQFQDGTPCWATTISFPSRRSFEFLVPQVRVRSGLKSIREALEYALRGANSADQMRDGLLAAGLRLSDLILRASPEEDTDEELISLAAELRGHPDVPIHYDYNIPVPLEMLAFHQPVGGVGVFSQFLAGRPDAYFVKRSRPGRTPGTGASLYHDDTMSSISGGECRAAVAQVFGVIDQHEELRKGERVRADAEISRLFSSNASWAHFQCHATYDGPEKSLRLTAEYPVSVERFRNGGFGLAAAVLNFCRAGDLVSGDDKIQSLEASWAEHFMHGCHVPVVIAPWCELEDDATMPFVTTFYACLATRDDVYESFVAAKQQRLEAGDNAALMYRYFGQPNLMLPADRRSAA